MHLTKRFIKIADQFRIDDGKDFRLKKVDPEDTAGMKAEAKHNAHELLQQSVKHLSELQDKLYASDRWGLLLIFQAMDAAGKDGTIKHVMSGLNPQGVDVHPFKAPSPEELDHDYLWRSMRVLPQRGRIGIFNRSYYEETLVVRVHPKLLDAEKLPEELITKNIWKERFEDIRHFERYLDNNGILVRKFFLHLSKQEQKKRFLERLDQPDKNWKFSAADLAERQCWDDYQDAYEEMIRHTAAKHAPWYVVPADNKWFTRLVVAAAVTDALRGLKLTYPTVSPEQKEKLEEARKELLSDGGKSHRA
jgi:PPK2 family polyphosphate:nucleotide phosphotransferase